jgi:hypothetical protein
MNPFGPKDIATPQIEEERLPVRERHKFRTLSLLGQTITVKLRQRSFFQVSAIRMLRRGSTTSPLVPNWQ